MTETPPPDARLDHDLIVLLDDALAMVADRLTPSQRAQLQERTGKMGGGLEAHIERQCSPEVQRVLLNRLDTMRVNPDGGRVGSVGESTSESALRKDGATVEEGSAGVSGTPTT
jgi:hypothetical protein